MAETNNQDAQTSNFDTKNVSTFPILRVKRKLTENPVSDLVLDIESISSLNKKFKNSAVVQNSVVFKLKQSITVDLFDSNPLQFVGNVVSQNLLQQEKIPSAFQKTRKLQAENLSRKESLRSNLQRSNLSDSKAARFRVANQNRKIELEDGVEILDVENINSNNLVNLFRNLNDFIELFEATSDNSEEIFDIYVLDETGEISENYAMLKWDSQEFVNDENESDEEVFEDEEDSNDEGNWRNEYPDEDEAYSDDEEGFGNGSDSDDNCYSRTQISYSRNYNDGYDGSDLYDETSD
ncbi:hypothetical protein HK096_003679 [Nowakowskiella sp. JEL0078]|nr:hypothetical protein HK096_003679 [Nowakowskiella sp. JEL0078]